MWLSVSAGAREDERGSWVVGECCLDDVHHNA